MASDEDDGGSSAYRRVVLKLSGEGLSGPSKQGIQMESVLELAGQVARAAESGVRIAVVLGGGNILRGGQFSAGGTPIAEVTAHTMGMLATVINGLAFQDALERTGCDTRLMTAIAMNDVAEPYIRRRADRHLNKGRIVIFVAGTGSPFVTTDTAAAQRALELQADILLKATQVDGVYSDDPKTNPDAVLHDRLTYQDVLRNQLRVMDQEAITKCQGHGMPVRVFNFHKEGNIERAVRGESVGTIIAAPLT